MQAIYTLKNSEQFIVDDIPMTLVELYSISEQAFINKLLKYLTGTELKEIAKISICIIIPSKTNIKLPYFIESNNGKFYFDDNSDDIDIKRYNKHLEEYIKKYI